MHHNRHKEIVVLIRKIKELDAMEASLVIPFAKKTDDDSTAGNRRRRSNGDDWSETFSDIFTEDPPETLKKREKKRLRKSGHGIAKDLEVFTKHDIDFVDEAIHCSERKDSVFCDEMDEDDLATVSNMRDMQDYQKENSGHLSPPASPLYNAPTKLKMSRRAVKSLSPLLTMTHKYKYFGRQAKRPLKDNSEIFGKLDPYIFHRLGIEVEGNHNSRRKELFTKLLEAIDNDIEIFEQEEREAEFRKEAFFRWAGRTGALAMVSSVFPQETSWISKCVSDFCFIFHK